MAETRSAWAFVPFVAILGLVAWYFSLEYDYVQRSHAGATKRRAPSVARLNAGLVLTLLGLGFLSHEFRRTPDWVPITGMVCVGLAFAALWRAFRRADGTLTFACGIALVFWGLIFLRLLLAF